MYTKRVATGHELLDPEQLLRRADLALGERVVDLGCGGGFFSIQAARMVGDNGIVYAVDVQKPVLSSVQSKARTFGLSNVQTVWSDAEVYRGAKAIADGSIDLVALVQLLFQTTHHDVVFKEVARLLKEKGRILVVDWKNHKLHIGPPADQCVKPEEVMALAEQFGFYKVKDIPAGPYHFGLLLQKKSR